MSFTSVPLPVKLSKRRAKEFLYDDLPEETDFSKTYHASEIVIHNSTTDVYIEELKIWVGSAVLTRKSFERYFDQALRYFDENPRTEEIGVFIKDYF